MSDIIRHVLAPVLGLLCGTVDWQLLLCALVLKIYIHSSCILIVKDYVVFSFGPNLPQRLPPDFLSGPRQTAFGHHEQCYVV